MRSRLFPLLLAATVTACGAEAVDLRTDDVAFLVPLEHARSFVTAPTVLPRALFDRLHPLTVVDEPDVLFANLATIAVRLDACFQEGAPVGPCRPQVRLVLQPVMDGDEGLTTRDAAVHAFYTATEAEIVALAKVLRDARSTRGLAAPAMTGGEHAGFADAAWRAEVSAALAPILVPERVVRTTAMSVHASNQAWIFAGLDLVGSTFEEISIPTLEAGTHEHHVTSTGEKTALEVTVDPASPVEGTVTEIIKPGALAVATADALTAAAAAVGRLEDPAAHNPGTVDCATCHVGALAKTALAARIAALGTDHPAPAVYSDTRNLRAYGYFFQDPAISPRVQREIDLVRADIAARME
ncbi:hypothetical protein L6R52_43310 [Myxococcota bacterium]|nr:hypothetical protein [Myxococcota bacterium]